MKLTECRVGQTATRTDVVSQARIDAFAALTGDCNPIHLDEAYAQATPFRGRIAHGMLVASAISALLAAELPGAGAIYYSQSLAFRRPVRPGDTITTRVTIRDIRAEKQLVVLETECSNQDGVVVLTGEAIVKVAE